MLTTRSAESGNRWDDEGADWARGGGIFGKAGGVTWAREAEVKHGRVCMLAAFGAIVQDLYTFPFMDKWYSGEKMWGLHEASVKSGALWQVCSTADDPAQRSRGVAHLIWPVPILCLLHSKQESKSSTKCST